MLQLLTAISFIGMALLLSACGTVTIKDSEWFGSLGSQGAAGFHTLTPASETLDLTQWATKWNDLSNPMICTQASTFADWKADIEKLCSKNTHCIYQAEQAFRQLNAFLQHP